MTEALQARLSRKPEAILEEVLTDRLDETVVTVIQQAVRQALESVHKRLDELTDFVWLVADHHFQHEDPADWWKSESDNDEETG